MHFVVRTFLYACPGSGSFTGDEKESEEVTLLLHLQG